MSWETRRNGRYYYRARRIGVRVLKEYVGDGFQGFDAAAVDKAKSVAKAQQRRQRERYLKALRELAQPLDELAEAAEQLVLATLLTRGVKQHHGTWRFPTDGMCRRDH